MQDLPWASPLDMEFIGMTSDSMSFKKLKEGEVEIPIGDHVGAFGVQRRHDIHKGVDLYAPVGTLVSAVEDGTIIINRPWTGEKSGCSWWEETDAVLICGESGIVAYGEIEIFGDIRPGLKVKKGQHLGFVKRVLKEDKGRPTSMLHIQMYINEPAKVGTWELGSPKPENLIDPTFYLVTWGSSSFLDKTVSILNENSDMNLEIVRLIKKRNKMELKVKNRILESEKMSFFMKAILFKELGGNK